jgi:hypothetical protein
MANFIDSIYANMRQSGYAKPNRWVALIKPNSYVSRNYLRFGGKGYAGLTTIQSRLLTTCFNATLPQKAFYTHDFGVTSPERKIPYGINSFNDAGASFEFYCLGDYFEKELFQQWMGGIVSEETRLADFYDSYTKQSEIDIIMLPSTIKSIEEVFALINNPTFSIPGIKLTEVYPYNLTINGGSLNYDQSQKPTTVKVDFMFREALRYKNFYDTKPAVDPIKSPNPEGPFQRELREKSVAEAQREWDSYQNQRLKADVEAKIVRMGMAFASQLQGFGIIG